MNKLLVISTTAAVGMMLSTVGLAKKKMTDLTPPIMTATCIQQGEAIRLENNLPKTVIVKSLYGYTLPGNGVKILGGSSRIISLKGFRNLSGFSIGVVKDYSTRLYTGTVSGFALTPGKLPLHKQLKTVKERPPLKCLNPGEEKPVRF